MIVHEPVLLAECLELLVPPADGGLIVDATLGQAGHAEAFLERWPRLALVGVDADAAVMETARARLARFGDRVELVCAWFAEFFASWSRGRAPDLVLFDLGISRFHYEMSGRGFSFDRDEPLDMRLSRELPASAADLVNGSGAEELADILERFGEERHARLIAARIVRERSRAPIETAARLADVIRGAVPPRTGTAGSTPPPAASRPSGSRSTASSSSSRRGSRPPSGCSPRAGGSGSSASTPSRTGS